MHWLLPWNAHQISWRDWSLLHQRYTLLSVHSKLQCVCVMSCSSCTTFKSWYLGSLYSLTSFSFDVGNADFAWGRTGLCRTATQCVGPGYSPGRAAALGDRGQRAVPATEGSTATTARPRPTSKGKTILKIRGIQNQIIKGQNDFFQWDKGPFIEAGQATWNDTVQKSFLLKTTAKNTNTDKVKYKKMAFPLWHKLI